MARVCRVKDHKARNSISSAVVAMSFAGPRSAALNDAVDAVSQAGSFVVVAAAGTCWQLTDVAHIATVQQQLHAVMHTTWMFAALHGMNCYNPPAQPEASANAIRRPAHGHWPEVQAVHKGLGSVDLAAVQSGQQQRLPASP